MTLKIEMKHLEWTKQIKCQRKYWTHGRKQTERWNRTVNRYKWNNETDKRKEPEKKIQKYEEKKVK